MVEARFKMRSIVKVAGRAFHRSQRSSVSRKSVVSAAQSEESLKLYRLAQSPDKHVHENLFPTGATPQARQKVEGSKHSMSYIGIL